MKMIEKKYTSSRLFTILTFVICNLLYSLYFSPITHASEAYKEGILLLANKEYISAIGYFKSKISSDSKDAAAYYYLGYSYYKTGDMAKAFSEFKRTFHLNPNFSIVKIASIKEKEGYLKMVMNNDKTDTGEERKFENLLRQSLNSIYHRDYAKAENQFRELIEKDSNVSKYHYYLGYVLYAQKKMAEALKEFKISYSIDPAF